MLFRSLYVLTGLVPYMGTIEAITAGAVSIKQNIHLVKNVMLPIELVPVRAVLVAAASGPLAGAMAELADDLHQRGARVLGIGGTPDFAGRCDVHLAGPDLPETVEPIASIVPAQLMIERLARTLGLDPDNPRGLAKVTQTDR